MTLVELIVAIGIMGIVTTGLTTFFSYMWRAKFDEINRGQSMLSASQSISKISKNIRRASQADSGSYALASAEDFDLVFYSDIDSDENRERVHYYLENGSIMSGTSEPILGDNPTYPENDEIVTVVANNVVNSPSEPIFSYFNAAGVEVSNIPSIRLIKLNVAVNVSPTRISNTVIETSVSLRNLNK
jgi:type II secretory pathway pseudopilin PulG